LPRQSRHRRCKTMRWSVGGHVTRRFASRRSDWRAYAGTAVTRTCAHRAIALLYLSPTAEAVTVIDGSPSTVVDRRRAR
jgi:hypothetical protein